MEVTVKLLDNAIRAALKKPTPGAAGRGGGKGRFLIDGFLRKMDQVIKFDEDVCPPAFVLFFTCTEEVMLFRLLKRGETSRREDGNIESIKKRFRTFEETSMPVIEYYRAKDKVVEVDSTPSAEEVYQKVKIAIDAQIATMATQEGAAAITQIPPMFHVYSKDFLIYRNTVELDPPAKVMSACRPWLWWDAVVDWGWHAAHLWCCLS